MARPFDAKRIEITGPAVEVTQAGMRTTEALPWPLTRWNVSRNGSLIYPPGSTPRMVLVRRDGTPEVLTSAPTPHRTAHGLSMSSDGRQIALQAADGDIWVYDRERKTSIRLTSDPAEDRDPIWSKEGRHILFTSYREGSFEIYRRQADGTGRVEKLGTGPYFTTSINSTRHADFWRIDIQKPPLVVKNDRNFSRVGRLSLSGPRPLEDDVGHLRAPEALGALFTKNPTYRIDYIRFPRSIRPHDDGYPGRELEACFIRKRLETEEFDCLKHGSCSKKS